MSIAVDAMGGDRAPLRCGRGAARGAREHGVPVILVGDAEIVRAELASTTRPASDHVKHADEVVGMAEPPSQAVRRKRKSLDVDRRAAGQSGEAERLVRRATRRGHALVPQLGHAAGCRAPAIAVLLPTLTGVTTMLDVGATVDCKPKHLAQFAVMGEIYARCILKRENPKVGLLSDRRGGGQGQRR